MARALALKWLADRRLAVVVTVVETRGSAPRGAGTRMLVDAEAAFGSIGGGHLEHKAIASARRLLLERGPSRREHFVLGPSLGQCCGGEVTLDHSVLDADVLTDWPVTEPLFHLQLYGAGHVGRAIATLLCTLDVQVDWIDERENEFSGTTGFGTPWPAHVRQVCVDAVEAEVAGAPPGGFYLVLTHDHDLDLRITEAILRRGDFSYLGLIGSKTKRERFLRRFEQRGVPAGALARLTCPIGGPAIDGKEPEVIALTTVAQLLQAATAARADRARARVDESTNRD